MRTTLDIDADILQAAKELALRHGTTAGKVLSELARLGLKPSDSTSAERHGVPLLPPRPGVELVTLQTVNRLRDEP